MSRESISLGDVWSRLTFVSPKVRFHLPSSHPVQQAFVAFDEFVEAMPDDMLCPPRAILMETLNAYLTLEVAELTQIMNGWNQSLERPSLAECPHREYGGIVHRYLRITSTEKFISARSEFDADDCEPRPVTLHVVEGTSRKAALKYLAEITQMVETNWSMLIAGDRIFTGKREKNSGMSEKLINPTPASNEGERAKALTAA